MIENNYMATKRLERIAFLRKLLCSFGITWDFVKSHECIYQSEVLYTFNYSVKLLNTIKLCYSIPIRIFKDDYETLSLNEIDYNYRLSETAVRKFFIIYGTKNLNENIRYYNHIKNTIAKLLLYFQIDTDTDTDTINFDVNNIDFENMIHNMILDGMQLDNFPTIENVI